MELMLTQFTDAYMRNQAPICKTVWSHTYRINKPLAKYNEKEMITVATQMYL